MFSLTLPNPSSESVHDFHDGSGYDQSGEIFLTGHEMEIRERIAKARESVGMTQTAFAAAIGKTKGAVSQWESGDVRPRHSTLTRIAEVTGKSLAWLESGMEDGASGMPVAGVVAAGVWRDDSLSFERYYSPVAAHPDYPAESQRLWRVEGNSINRIVTNGEYVHSVEIASSGTEPRDGDLVIAMRTRHGSSEYTVKRLVKNHSGWVLRPETLDSSLSADVPINGDEDTEISIIDIVIAKWSPINRGTLK